MKLSEEQIRKIALTFCQDLYDDMGEKDYIEMIEQNEKEADEDICHSHDYVDANMYMLDAFEKHGYKDLDALIMMRDDNWGIVWQYAHERNMLIADIETREMKENARK